MKKPVIAVLSLVVLGVLIGGYVVLHGRSTPNTGTMTTMGMPSSDSDTSGSAMPVATDTVAIQNFAFSPASITVKKGTTVTWTNKDSVAHTVTETDGQSGPDSSDMSHGGSYSFTFNTVGTFHYHCAIHHSMLGTVMVTE